MTATDIHTLELIIVMGIVTYGTRIISYVAFGTKEEIPPIVSYFGDVVPFAAMGMLVVYCLKDVSIMSGSHGIPEIIAIASVVLLHLWKSNTVLSVIVGTAIYMVLVQMVF